MAQDILDRRLKRIEGRLSAALPQAAAKRWVKVSFVQQVTGWNKEAMRRARAQEIIEWKKDANGIWYNLNSIPERLINR